MSESETHSLLLSPALFTTITSATMTFNGTWKIDRNDNYEKFMEQMGECRRLSFCLASLFVVLEETHSDTKHYYCMCLHET